MKTKFLALSVMIYNHSTTLIQKALNDKKLLAFLLLTGIASEANAQNELNEVTKAIDTRMTSFLKLLNILVLAGLAFYGAKTVIEALRGEQGAWQKFGGILIVIAIWFFGFPALINSLKTTPVQ